MQEDKRVIIFDTTLRDGEQSPGATMSLKEKVLIAKALEELGVDIIEAGFAASSSGDFNTILEIAKNAKEATICSLARSVKSDIQKAYDAIKVAPKHRIHLFISTSPIHREYKLKFSKDEILVNIKEMVSYAKSLCKDVQWSAEDATRTELDFLTKCVQVAIESGATTINLPDTVGYSTPQDYYDMFKEITNNIDNKDNVVFSCHCHNDLGLATANSLSSLKAGVAQIECTINGIGERAGNAALEEIVMALKTRYNYYGMESNIKTQNLTKVSKMVSTISGFVIQPNKAIVGANAFAHEAGIHQDGYLKNPQTYEIMTPESVGLKETQLPLGKHSGRAALKDKLSRLGIQLQEDKFLEFFQDFKKLADNKKYILDEDIYALINYNKEGKDIDGNFILQDYKLNTLEENQKEAIIYLMKNNEIKKGTFISSGSINALFKAINIASNFNADLIQYNVHAITKGVDAIAEVSVRMRYQDKTFTAHSRDIDTIKASLKAYINGINTIIKDIEDN